MYAPLVAHCLSSLARSSHCAKDPIAVSRDPEALLAAGAAIAVEVVSLLRSDLLLRLSALALVGCCVFCRNI
jgi:hypothetical protein